MALVNETRSSNNGAELLFSAIALRSREDKWSKFRTRGGGALAEERCFSQVSIITLHAFFRNIEVCPET